MKKERHDPTTCLLSAKYCWEASKRGNATEQFSWVWLFRFAGMPV